LKEFASHSDETDPERIEQIIRRALQDAEWVVQKVNKSTKRVKVATLRLELSDVREYYQHREVS